MTKLTIFGALALTVFASVLFAAPAVGQAQRTWVSSYGDDANPCTPSAPCRTFAGALSKTSSGGEIDALDGGGFGGMNITKDVTIDGGGGHVASVMVTSGAGVSIFAPGGVITLRNLSFQGHWAGSNGVNLLHAERLSIEHCTIQNFTTYGVAFAPRAASTRLTITDTVIQGNSYGIVMIPAVAGLGPVYVMLDNVRVFHNDVGLYVGDNVAATATRSMISMNLLQGITVATFQGPALLHLSDSSVSNNTGPGLNLSQTGGHAVVQLADTDIVSNAGASMQIGAGTDVISFGTNRIANNGLNTLPNGSALLH